MGLKRLTTTARILPIEDIKAHLRIDGTQDDSAMEVIQTAAVDYIERSTGIQLGTAAYRLTLNRFPAGRTIRLPKPPFAGGQVVTFIDPTGTTKTLDPASYTAHTDEHPGCLTLNAGHEWPATSDNGGAVTIDFNAGNPAGQEPEVAKHLVRLIVGSWFESREASTDRTFSVVPHAAEALLPLLQTYEGI